MITTPSTRPYFSQKQLKLISKSTTDILKTGRLILGPYTQLFEKNFANFIGTKYAVSTNSCTSALEIALRFCNVKDSEVIVPTNTFVASANAIIFAGGSPVLADIDKESLCLNINSLVQKINKKTKAVIVVHIAGLIHPQINEIKDICRQKKLFLIEDAAHAFGASLNGKKAGSLGDVACFSFYPTKIITTGTGGMITTNNKKLAQYARILRHHGALKGLEDIQELGNDWVLDEFRAAIGIAQLNEVGAMIKKRRMIAKKYDGEIRNSGVQILQNFPDIRHVYYKYPLLFKNSKIRNKVKNILRTKYDIETGSVYFPPVHQMPLYKKMNKVKDLDFTVAEEVLPRVLCLPIFPQMTNAQIRYVTESLKEVISEIK